MWISFVVAGLMDYNVKQLPLKGDGSWCYSAVFRMGGFTLAHYLRVRFVITSFYARDESPLFVQFFCISMQFSAKKILQTIGDPSGKF